MYRFGNVLCTVRIIFDILYCASHLKFSVHLFSGKRLNEHYFTLFPRTPQPNKQETRFKRNLSEVSYSVPSTSIAFTAICPISNQVICPVIQLAQSQAVKLALIVDPKSLCNLVLKVQVFELYKKKKKNKKSQSKTKIHSVETDSTALLLPRTTINKTIRQKPIRRNPRQH